MNTLIKAANYVASENPVEDIEKISYPGQPENRKRYQAGYEHYFNSLPVLSEDETLKEKLFITKEVMKHLSEKLQQNEWEMPEANHFIRTIISLEEPLPIKDGYKEGAELVVAHWGQGHTSPIHGHATGYMHEEIISGKMRVNTYRIVDDINRVVRPVETTIQTPGVFVSDYAPHNPEAINSRETLVHNFTAVEPSISLHFLPEHTRDGRDNTFTLEEFPALWRDQVVRIDSKEGLYAQVGEVILVRSTNVPEYDDHFIVITGHPVMKTHGFRPQERSIMASKNHSKLLDMFPLTMGLTLLKLTKEAAQAFLMFHGIIIKDKEVIFPND